MIVDILPQNLAQIPLNFYTATIEALPNAGYYDFDATVPVFLFNAPGASTLLWDSIQITTTVDPLSYLGGLVPSGGAVVPTAVVKWDRIAGGANSFFPKFSLAHLGYTPLRFFYKTPSADNSDVNVSFSGLVSQTAFAVPPASIALIVTFGIYEINDDLFVALKNTRGIG